MGNGYHGHSCSRHPMRSYGVQCPYRHCTLPQATACSASCLLKKSCSTPRVWNSTLPIHQTNSLSSYAVQNLIIVPKKWKLSLSLQFFGVSLRESKLVGRKMSPLSLTKKLIHQVYLRQKP